jgi:UDP-glucose 4-epimerase
MARYLITGGAGFIGSHLVEWLLKSGHRLTVIDDFSTGSRNNLPTHPELSIVEKDLLHLTDDELGEPFHAVVHLAALPSVTASWANLSQSHALNLTATVRVIELAQYLRIPRIVYASSAAVYGDANVVPIEEMQRLRPASPYGLQKVSGEEYGRLCAGKNLSFVALRFFNVFGPRQVAGSPYSGVITIFAQAMRKNQSITVFGGGGQTRDFVFVKDIALAIASALEISGLDPFTVCNLGSGAAVSIRQLVATMRQFFPEWSGSINEAPARLGDIVHSAADISAAQTLLSYQPRYSLESGLAEMLQLGESPIAAPQTSTKG